MALKYVNTIMLCFIKSQSVFLRFCFFQIPPSLSFRITWIVIFCCHKSAVLNPLQSFKLILFHHLEPATIVIIERWVQISIFKWLSSWTPPYCHCSQIQSRGSEGFSTTRWKQSVKSNHWNNVEKGPQWNATVSASLYDDTSVLHLKLLSRLRLSNANFQSLFGGWVIYKVKYIPNIKAMQLKSIMPH